MSSRNEKRFELRLGKWGFVLLTAGLSVLVFASFWAGLQMGRDMETPTIQVSRVSPLPPAPAPPIVAEGAAPGHQATAPPAAGVSPAPQASSSGQAVSPPVQAGAPDKPAAPVRAAVPPPSQPAKGTEGNAAAAAKKANGGKPAAVPAPVPAEPKAAVPPDAKAVRTGEAAKKETYNLQVASYKERAKADETAKKLGPLGLKPRVLAVDLPKKGRWYRVVVGGFESREAAQKAADRIAKKIKGTTCIIRKS